MLRMLGFEDGEPVFAVDDERVSLLDRLVVAVDEGPALEALKGHELATALETPAADAAIAATGDAASNDPPSGGDPQPDLV